MNIQIQPQPLQGNVAAIPSKSHAHRLLICAALADAPVQLRLGRTSIDIDTTREALMQLGAHITVEDDLWSIQPISDTPETALIDMRESGSTLRLLLPLVAALNIKATLLAGGRLPERPMEPLLDALVAHGAQIKPYWPMQLSGPLQGGTFEMPGDVSSQFISGLLLAAPLLTEATHIVLTSPLQSRPYVNLTIDTMRTFGVMVEERADGFYVPATAAYQAPETCITVEGDWSSAAFFLAAGALTGPITMTGLNLTSRQGDRAILNLLTQFGAIVTEGDNTVTLKPGERRPLSVSMEDIPDLLPILSVLAAAAEGESLFYHAARLRMKESDRLASTRAFLEAMGATVIESVDQITIKGHGTLHGGDVHSANDHRIAMSAAIAAACLATEPVTIAVAEAVQKSYPSFYDDFSRLGGITHVL